MPKKNTLPDSKSEPKFPDFKGLTPEQEKMAEELYDGMEIPDINIIGRRIFGSDFKGTDKRGHAIRNYLGRLGKETTHYCRSRPEVIELTEEQKKQIRELLSDDDYGVIELARIVFSDQSIIYSRKEVTVVKLFVNDLKNQAFEEQEAFLRANKLDKLEKKQQKQLKTAIKQTERMAIAGAEISDDETWAEETEDDEENYNPARITKLYSPPRTIKTAVKKINYSTGNSLDVNALNKTQLETVGSLLKNLASPRFRSVINTYDLSIDKQLFETEFIKHTWDKYDLTIEDTNIYIDICTDQINLKQTERQIAKLNQFFEAAEDSNELTVKMSEAIGQLRSDYDRIAKRLATNRKMVNEARSTRLKERQSNSATWLAILEEFKTEEGRKTAATLAELRKKNLDKEKKKFEAYDSNIGRLLGFSIEEL